MRLREDSRADRALTSNNSRAIRICDAMLWHKAVREARCSMSSIQNRPVASPRSSTPSRRFRIAVRQVSLLRWRFVETPLGHRFMRLPSIVRRRLSLSLGPEKAAHQFTLESTKRRRALIGSRQQTSLASEIACRLTRLTTAPCRTADAHNAVGGIALVDDIDWPPRGVTMRVLDVDACEVHSEVKDREKAP